MRPREENNTDLFWDPDTGYCPFVFAAKLTPGLLQFSQASQNWTFPVPIATSSTNSMIKFVAVVTFFPPLRVRRVRPSTTTSFAPRVTFLIVVGFTTS